jgi:hypothetical protein
VQRYNSDYRSSLGDEALHWAGGLCTYLDNFA